MKIGDVSRETGLSISNIRFYEKKGLLQPNRLQVSKYRDYSKDDIKRLQQIVLLRKIDISIENISEILNENTSFPVCMGKQEIELEKKIEELKGALELCRKMKSEESIQNLNVQYYMSYMAEQEKKGNKFAKVNELIGDFMEYSEVSIGRGLLLGLIYSAGRFGNLIRYGFWLIWITLIGLVIYKMATGNVPILNGIVAIIAFISMTFGYAEYRRNRM